MSADGWHCATIADSSVHHFGKEAVLLLELSLEDGQAAVDLITLESRDPEAVRTGCAWLSTVCHAVGWRTALSDSDQLHGLRCLVFVWRGRVLAYDSDPLVRWLAGTATAEASTC